MIQAYTELTTDLNREIIYGPNGYYVTVGDRPHQEMINSQLIVEQPAPEKWSVAEIKNAVFSQKLN